VRYYAGSGTKFTSVERKLGDCLGLDEGLRLICGFLNPQNKIERFGDPDEGVIYLPLLDSLACDR
jgi:hypothetical protein